MTTRDLIPIERVERAILLIRGEKVMLDSDLAELYGVTVRRLNEQVKRNISRFPEDFMFQLTEEEAGLMRSQIATASKRNIRYRPYVFTEHGALMLTSVLNSPVAVEASIKIVRVFVRLREVLATYKDLARKIENLERKSFYHDEKFKVVLEAIKGLMKPPSSKQRRIGF